MPDTTLPANQGQRIAILRIWGVVALGCILLVDPAGSDGSIVSELLEPSGALMVIAGVLGRAWSMLYIGGRKNWQVVGDGPYSMCRHPLYLFSTLAATGLGAMLGSITLAFLLGGATRLILMRTARREEVFLRAAFPETYAAYTTRVPLILPDPRLFHTPPEVTFTTRNLRSNGFDALVFLSFIPLAEVVEGLHVATGWTVLSLY